MLFAATDGPFPLKNIITMKKILIFLLLALTAQVGYASDDEDIGNGVNAIEEKRYDDAFKYFDGFVKEHPKNGVGYYFRSQAALGVNNKVQALSDINTALTSGRGFLKKQEIKKDEMLVQRGLVYLSMNDEKSAITDFSEALTVNPKNVNALVFRGKAYAEDKLLMLSDSDYTKALTIDVTNLQANLGMIQNLVVREDYQKAISRLTKLEELYPNNEDIHIYRGEAYQMMGRYNEAFDDVLSLISAKDDYNSTLPLLVARAIQCDTYSLPKISAKVASGEKLDLWLQARAKMYELMDRYDDAIADYNALEQELKDTYAPICVGRGDCQKHKGNYILAMKEYQKALDLEETPKAYAQIAIIKRNEGKLDSAMAFANKAVNSDPSNPEFYYIRGKIRESRRDSDQALRDYEMGLSIDKHDVRLLAARGMCELKRKQQQQARNDFDEISYLERVVKPCDNRKALALHFLGQENDASACIDKELAKFPTAANYYDAALLFAASKMDDKAVDALGKSFNAGFREFGALSYEPALKQLRKTSAYADLMQKWGISDNNQQASSTTGTGSDSTSQTNVKKGTDIPIIPCTVDGMKLTFTTNSDTAKVFSISLMDVQFLLKYGYMQRNDIVAPRGQKSDTRNLAAGSKVIIRAFKWGNKVLRDVEATIVADPQAPILITQGKLNEIDK